METKIIRDKKGRFMKGTVIGGMKGKIGWNKGLTKEIDERLKKAAINQSKVRQEGIKNGNIKIWNKDLTKQQDVIKI